MGGGPSTQGRFTGRLFCLPLVMPKSVEVSAVIGDQRWSRDKIAEVDATSLCWWNPGGGRRASATAPCIGCAPSSFALQSQPFKRESVGNHFCVTAHYYVFTACKLPRVEKKDLGIIVVF